MKQRIITIILFVSCVILGVSAFFVSAAKDKKAPVISVTEKEITYVEGTDREELLQGVSAEDNRDGDVSDRVFVDRVIPMAGDKEAIVYYAVTDKSNNVGTGKRVVKYSVDGIGVEEQTPAEDADESASADNQEPAAEAGAPAEQGVYPPDPIDVSAGKPVVQVTAQQNTIAVGSTVNLMDFIKMIYDVDTSNENHNYMYAHISINVNGTPNSSAFTANTAGTYQVQYLSGNKNGVWSDPTEMTLIAQ